MIDELFLEIGLKLPALTGPDELRAALSMRPAQKAQNERGRQKKSEVPQRRLEHQKLVNFGNCDSERGVFQGSVAF